MSPHGVLRERALFLAAMERPSRRQQDPTVAEYEAKEKARIAKLEARYNLSPVERNALYRRRIWEDRD